MDRVIKFQRWATIYCLLVGNNKLERLGLRILPHEFENHPVIVK